MADDADKPIDDNEAMVKALESIKSLLATSETKLSQARESINQASAHSLKMTSEVPVLDEVIVPGKPHESTETEMQTATTTEPEETSQQIDLTSFKAQLETEIHEKLLKFAQQLELE